MIALVRPFGLVLVLGLLASAPAHGQKKNKAAVPAAVAAPAPAPALPAPPPLVIDPRWGVLGEVAERDFSTRGLFTLGTEVPIAFRWVVPNREMLLTYLGPAKGEHRLKLDPATGEIERSWKNLLGTTKETLQVDSAGNVILAGTTDALFLRKNGDGTYWLRWSVDNKQTLAPLTTRTPKVEQLFAAAGIKPGRPGLSRPVDTAALAGVGNSSQNPTAVSNLAMVPQPAFEFLENGVYASGKLPTARAVACYYFETTPGQKLQAGVSGSNGLDPMVTVGAGASCDSKLRVYGRNDDAGGGTRDAVVQFVAGGGTYVAQVSSASSTTGDYVVRFRDNQDASRKFPPGLPIREARLPQFVDGVSASTAPPSGTPAPRAGTTIQDCAECPALVAVKAGSFFMGSSAAEEGHQANEGPRHMVRIANPFAIGKYEVTFDEWDACAKDKGCARAASDNTWGRGRRPVVNVSWTDAMQYVRWLRRKTGQNYYLPSEAEWEYAARAGTTTPWNTGSAIITDDANILNALGRTVPVGGYPANAFGLHDTHGNVAEWVADCYEIGYFGTPINGAPMAAKGCTGRIFRGESYLEQPVTQRVARRVGPILPSGTGKGLGFRIARSL